MKGFGFLFLAALCGVSAQCAEVREGSVSMFVPGSYQSYSMAFVGNGEAEAKEVNFVSTEGQSAEVNGKVYKIIDASEVGLGTLYFRQEGKRAFRLDAEQKTEVACYDFELKKGESFTAPDGIVWEVMDDRDTLINLPTGDAWSSHLQFVRQKEHPEVTDVWQEGVGSWHYGFFTPEQLTHRYAHVGLLSCLMDCQTFPIDRFPLWGSSLGKPHTYVPDLSSQSKGEWEKKWADRDSLGWTLRNDTLYIKGFVCCTHSSSGLYAWSFIHDGTAVVHVEPTALPAYMKGWYSVDIHIPCHGATVKEVKMGENTVPQASAPAQTFFPEGTRWTELRLDTREHQTWCDEEKRDGGSVLVPNYEQIEYYVQGDSTDEVLTYRYVWRHMEGKPDSIAFVICEDANEVMVTQPFYETLDGMEIFCFEFPAVVYDFAWRTGHNFWFQDMYESATTCFPTHTYSFGVLKEVSRATFGTSHTLEYVDVDSLITYTPQVDATVQRTARPLGMKAKLLKGIGITAWCGSSCLLAPACPDEYSDVFQCILARFERNGEVLYDLWPNAKGELEAHIQSTPSAISPASAIYDLQGRKLPAAPAHGIYLKDGKKYLGK